MISTKDYTFHFLNRTQDKLHFSYNGMNIVLWWRKKPAPISDLSNRTYQTFGFTTSTSSMI